MNFEELRSRNFRAKYGEVDVAGIVVHVTSLSSDQQNKYAVDNLCLLHGNLLLIILITLSSVCCPTYFQHFLFHH